MGTTEPDLPMLNWETMIDEYGPLVVRISWRILGTAAEVEENVQDVFAEAWQRCQENEVHHWWGFLRRLATIGALRRLRTRRRSVPLDDIALLDSRSSPEDALISRELEARLRTAVAELPEREGAVFSLRYYEGLSLSEIAETLGIKYGAAGTALSRARNKLQAVFAETAIEED
jgi:RNA polymerase sigma-70 factor (ECF subfamily)